MASNDRVGISFAQPKTFIERVDVAKQCNSALEMGMPLVVDTLDNKVELAYGAFPDRLYVIDRHGKVAFKGGRGPFGYEPEKLERTLVMLLLHQQTPVKKVVAAKAKPAKAKPAKEAKKKKEDAKKEGAKKEAKKPKPDDPGDGKKKADKPPATKKDEPPGDPANE